jgi:hypothetical protein
VAALADDQVELGEILEQHLGLPLALGIGADDVD